MADWQGLELRHLVALAAVAEHGTISKAADALGYTQSAVSQQVAGLERAVGTPVFDRPGGPRPLTLTEAGEVLLSHVRTVLAQLRLAEADVGAVVAGERGTLRVGTVQSVGTRVLPDVLRGFHLERPGVQVQLRESHDPGELLQLVAAGELDVTFCEQPIADGPWRHREVLVDPFVLVAPATSPEAAAPSFPLEDVAGLPLIGYRNDACASHRGVFEAIGRDASYVFQSDDNTTIQGCVGAGLGFALVPRLTIDPDDPAIRLIDLDPPPPPRVLAVAWASERRDPPALDAFLACVQATCDRLAAAGAVAAS
jgi:DNA-binding transcriptional LysR family regulator